jgi:hypothetical protein
MWEPFWEGLQPQQLNTNGTGLTSGDTGFPAYFLNQVCNLNMKDNRWWWIYMPIHSIVWRLSNTFHMFYKDLRTILSGIQLHFNHWIMDLIVTSSDPRYPNWALRTSLIKVAMCSDNGWWWTQMPLSTAYGDCPTPFMYFTRM